MHPQPKASSAGLVLFAILHHVSLALSAIFFAASFIDGPRDLWRVFAVLFAIPATVFSMLILYRGWVAVQDGSAQSSPGKAVGFCFIPFFQLYWIFVAYVGLMKEFNRLAEARGRQDQKVNEGIALTLCILTVTLCLSYLALPFGVVFIWQVIGAVKDLENA